MIKDFDKLVLECNLEKTQERENPYLDLYKNIMRDAEDPDINLSSKYEEYTNNLNINTDEISDIRMCVSRKYGNAIPNRVAIRLIRRFFPIIEIGAGLGYWAHLINIGSDDDFVCFDSKDHQDFSDSAPYYTVKKGGPEKILEHPKNNLLLIWPPDNAPMAFECANNFEGECLIYVGEARGGIMGDDSFFDLLESKFAKVGDISLPNWPGHSDKLYIFKKIS